MTTKIRSPRPIVYALETPIINQTGFTPHYSVFETVWQPAPAKQAGMQIRSQSTIFGNILNKGSDVEMCDLLASHTPHPARSAHTCTVVFAKAKYRDTWYIFNFKRDLLNSPEILIQTFLFFQHLGRILGFPFVDTSVS